MSKRGNCWDNTPKKSFFGHTKDEVNIKAYKTFDNLQAEFDDYMSYYNNFRYQWN